jgi:hypothetical protein
MISGLAQWGIIVGIALGVCLNGMSQPMSDAAEVHGANYTLDHRRVEKRKAPDHRRGTT